jgi:hypothetical protein
MSGSSGLELAMMPLYDDLEKRHTSFFVIGFSCRLRCVKL